ncbi:MAG TPA: hypothetical protein VHF91_06055, partial [Acidimicrobiales bacterium]|nr:hypothetical protein [Acidimicrobiales bacterium]
MRSSGTTYSRPSEATRARAALGLLRAARARAASLGREYVVPDDLKLLAGPVLEHRLALTPDAQLRGV